jgi:hypothetical protein
MLDQALADRSVKNGDAGQSVKVRLLHVDETALS